MSAQKVGVSVIQQTMWLLWVSVCSPSRYENTDLTYNAIVEMIAQNEVYESAFCQFPCALQIDLVL